MAFLEVLVLVLARVHDLFRYEFPLLPLPSRRGPLPLLSAGLEIIWVNKSSCLDEVGVGGLGPRTLYVLLLSHNPIKLDAVQGEVQSPTFGREGVGRRLGYHGMHPVAHGEEPLMYLRLQAKAVTCRGSEIGIIPSQGGPLVLEGLQIYALLVVGEIRHLLCDGLHIDLLILRSVSLIYRGGISLKDIDWQ